MAFSSDELKRNKSLFRWRTNFKVQIMNNEFLQITSFAEPTSWFNKSFVQDYILFSTAAKADDVANRSRFHRKHYSWLYKLVTTKMVDQITKLNHSEQNPEYIELNIAIQLLQTVRSVTVYSISFAHLINVF